jgi:hypothetical protein
MFVNAGMIMPPSPCFGVCARRRRCAVACILAESFLERALWPPPPCTLRSCDSMRQCIYLGIGSFSFKALATHAALRVIRSTLDCWFKSVVRAAERKATTATVLVTSATGAQHFCARVCYAFEGFGSASVASLRQAGRGVLLEPAASCAHCLLGAICRFECPSLCAAVCPHGLTSLHIGQ